MKSWNDFLASRTAKIIGGAIVSVLIVIFVFLAFGVASALLMFVLIGVIIYFGALKELAGSIIIAFLLKMLLPEITDLVAIFTHSAKFTQVLKFIGETNYLKMTMVIFVIAFSLRFITGSIRIFNINIRNGISSTKTKPQGKEKE